MLLARTAASAVIAGMPRRELGAPLLEDARRLVQEISAAGLHDRAVSAEDFVQVKQLAQDGWPGLLAAMLLVPAWQWPEAPGLEQVPIWLWADYARYLFAVPQGFTACGQAETFSAHYLRRLEELAKLVATNRGSSAIKALVSTYVQFGNCIPLYFSTSSLRRHYELRGRVLMAAAGATVSTEDDFPPTREGRRLRIGFINRHFGPQTETYCTVPTFEHLDPERFEVILFSHRAGDSKLEAFARQRVQQFQLLPQDANAQVAMLRAAALDVAIFGTNMTANFNEVTQLALHRVAPLQVVNNSSCTTTGLPEMDMYISGSLTEVAEAPEHFTERLALLRGPTHAFNYEADQQQPTTSWTRAGMGIPADAVVFVSAANYFKVIPEMREAWARLLADVPNSRLLLHPFNPNWSSEYPIKRFRSELDGVLDKHGVARDRLIVSSARFPSRMDVKELLRVGDIYLDTFPFGGVNSLIDPLEIGIPVITWEGTTFRSRMGSALLRDLGLEQLIATDAKSYHAICAGLAGDPARRTELRTKIADLMDRKPVFMDTLASSDAFGELLLLAYDELAQVGRQTFRSSKTVITAETTESAESVAVTVSYLLELGMTDEAARQVQKLLASEPISVEARHLMGKLLLAQKRPARAVDYLVAAVNRGTAPAVVWRDLATALRRSGNRPGATQAIEASLRLDESDPEAWFILAEFAFECGHHEILVEASKIVSKLAPEDPRTARLAEASAKLPSPAAV